MCYACFSILLLSSAALVLASVLFSGRLEHGVSGGFSCRPSADVLTGLELPGERAALQTETSSSGTDGSSSCSGVGCLLIDLRGVLEEQENRRTDVPLCSDYCALWVFLHHKLFTYLSGEGGGEGLLFVTVAGLTLVLAAVDLVLEPLFELFLGVSCFVGDLI